MNWHFDEPPSDSLMKLILIATLIIGCCSVGLVVWGLYELFT